MWLREEWFALHVWDSEQTLNLSTQRCDPYLSAGGGPCEVLVGYFLPTYVAKNSLSYAE